MAVGAGVGVGVGVGSPWRTTAWYSSGVSSGVGEGVGRGVGVGDGVSVGSGDGVGSGVGIGVFGTSVTAAMMSSIAGDFQKKGAYGITGSAFLPVYGQRYDRHFPTHD